MLWLHLSDLEIEIVTKLNDNDWFFFFCCSSYRKDSFITHRAFCDALAEESARITTVSATNILNNLRNDSINLLHHHQNPQQSLIDHHNNLQSLGEISVLSQFNHSDQFLRDFEDQQQKNRSPLSLWLNQASSDNAINNNNISAHFFGASSSSPSNLFGSIAENGPLSMLPVIEKEEDVENKGSLSKATAAALLSGQSSSSSPMSATALLQKAALMGSTRSSNNNSPLFGAGAFGVMSSSSSSSNAMNLNSLNKSRSLTMNDSVQMLGNSSNLSSNCLSQLLLPPNGKI